MKTIPTCFFLLMIPVIFSEALLAQPSKKIRQLNVKAVIALEHNKDKPAIGLSAIRYDKWSGQFILLSDDTGTVSNGYQQAGKARFYTVHQDQVLAALRNSGNSHHDIETIESSHIHEVLLTADPDSSQWLDRKNWLHDGHVDTEGLALIPNSTDLLIASEQGATYPFTPLRLRNVFSELNPFRIPEFTVEPALLRVDRNTGMVRHRYQVPSYYRSYLTWGLVPDYFQKPLLKLFPHEKVGPQKNKGIESIDFIPGTNEVIAIVEAPLLQDIDPWFEAYPDALSAPCRIVQLSMNRFMPYTNYRPRVSRELFYQVDNMPIDILTNPDAAIKTGVSDVIALDESSLLVVERTFIKNTLYTLEDPRQSTQSIVEIFLVDLTLAKQYHVTGQAYLTADQMKSKRTVKKRKLFTSLDYGEDHILSNLNIEGITFGPDIDGKRSIVLINDNGGSEDSLSLMTVLTVDE